MAEVTPVFLGSGCPVQSEGDVDFAHIDKADLNGDMLPAVYPLRAVYY